MRGKLIFFKGVFISGAGIGEIVERKPGALVGLRYWKVVDQSAVGKGQ